jgi:hypothetical protein
MTAMNTRLSWRQVSFVALVLAGACTDRVLGQGFGHSDLDFSYENGRIVSRSGDVITSSFPTSGISQQFTSNPGFASETDAGGGIGPDEDVTYTVLDDLQFWDGTLLTMPREDVQIRIQNNPPVVPDTIVHGSSGTLEGSFDPPMNRIGKANEGGEFHAHVNFFLESVGFDDSSRPDVGAYGLKLQLQSNSDAVLASEPLFFLFNFGLTNEEFATAVDQFLLLLSNNTMPGDFDSDGDLDVEDLDTLTLATFATVPDQRFDLNLDSQVDQRDREFWILDLKQTYIGDSNLDGEFNTSDLVQVLQRGEYEDDLEGNSLWSDGDWNGDLEFNTSDLVYALQSGGYEQGQRAGLAGVPEPGTRWLVTIGLLVLGLIRRRRDGAP